MPTIHYILKDGSTRAVEAKPGASAMETAIRGNVRGIDAECGGSCACATCHVYVDEAFAARLPPPDELESEMLEVVAAVGAPATPLLRPVTVAARAGPLPRGTPTPQPGPAAQPAQLPAHGDGRARRADGARARDAELMPATIGRPRPAARIPTHNGVPR